MPKATKTKPETAEPQARKYEALDIRVEGITVPEGRREDLGDLDGLASSIQVHGLMNPIIVEDTQDDEGNQDLVLIAGGRRLAACKLLGMERIPARMLATLSPVERRTLELEENTRRKDLTAYEHSRSVVALVDAVAEALREEALAIPSEPDGIEKPGRDAIPDNREAIARRTGLSTGTISSARLHLAAVQEFPELASESSKETAVRKAKELRAAAKAETSAEGSEETAEKPQKATQAKAAGVLAAIDKDAAKLMATLESRWPEFQQIAVVEAQADQKAKTRETLDTLLTWLGDAMKLLEPQA